MCFIKNIIQCLIKNNVEIFDSSIKSNFEELLTNSDKIRHTCRYNMSDMLNSSVKESMEELMKIDFANYPIPSDEEKRSFSDYVKKYHKINSAYASMINAFEDGDISNTLQEIFKLFFDKLENGMKLLNDKNRLVDANAQKQ